MLKTLSDEQLVTRFAAGESLAFDILMLRHQSRVFNYIYFMVKKIDLAEDLYQETFIKAITTIQQGRYVDNGKFIAWLMRVAHNLVIDYFRQERIFRLYSSDDFEYDIFNSIEFAENTIEEKWVIHQTYQEIKELIEVLPESQQEVVMMRFYQDMSFKEIAEATHVSINTALGRMRYAMHNMRRLLSEV